MTRSRIIETVLEEVSGVKSLLLRKSDGRRVNVPLGASGGGSTVTVDDKVEAYFYLTVNGVSPVYPANKQSFGEVYGDGPASTVPSWATIVDGTLQIASSGIYNISGEMNVLPHGTSKLYMDVSFVAEDANGSQLAFVPNPFRQGSWNIAEGPLENLYKAGRTYFVPWVGFLPAGARMFGYINAAVVADPVVSIALEGALMMNKIS